MSDPKPLTQQSRDLAKRLDAIPAAILERLRPALVRSGNEIARNMTTLVPKDTGDLAESITVTGPGETTPAYAADGGKRTAGPNQVLVTVGDEDNRHGHLVEFGTVNMEAQPFLRPGYRIAKPRVERRIKAAISSAIRRAAKND